MELKQKTVTGEENASKDFNRTNMELKLNYS